MMDRVLLEFLTEMIGTAVFLSVIIFTGNAIMIGLTLTVVIYIGQKYSNAHFNPAVNFMMLIGNKISTKQFITETTAQILGAFLAVLLYKNRTQINL